MRILIAEDDHVSRRVLEAHLGKWGYQVLAARDGEEAWQVLQSADPPRLAILDWMMPGLDGFQATKKLKDDPDTRHIGVLMLTAKGGIDDNVKESYKMATRVQDRMKGFDSGAVDFLTKPVKAKDLVLRVKAVLWATGFGITLHED